jgi:hypothetical protein
VVRIVEPALFRERQNMLAFFPPRDHNALPARPFGCWNCPTEVVKTKR